MDRRHPINFVFFFALASAAGCQHMNRYESPTHDGFAKATFQVHGMMKAKSGAT